MTTLDCPTLSSIYIYVKVLASMSVVIPSRVVKRLGLILGANLFIELIDTFLII